MGQFVDQLPSMYAIFMGYWVLVQVRTISSSVLYKSKFRMGDMTLRRFVMIPCEMLFRYQLRSNSIIDIIVSVSDRVDDLGDALLPLWYYMCPCIGHTHFPGNLG